MSSNDEFYIVIAAYREDVCIGNVVAELRRVFRNVVVVDDGSGDHTGEEALAAGAFVLTHPFNLGQGAALQTGITFALRQGARYIATFDADGQHSVADLRRMFDEIRTSNVDVLLGSRTLGATIGAPLVRRWLICAVVLHARITTGLSVTDAHNGLRILTGAAAAAIKLQQNRMAHASEILSKIAALRLRYREFPVTIKYTAYSLRKGQRLRDAVTILFDLFVAWIAK
jgi:glycosyltransferase involved in cell wall biosynthesis